MFRVGTFLLGVLVGGLVVFCFPTDEPAPSESARSTPTENTPTEGKLFNIEPPSSEAGSKPWSVKWINFRDPLGHGEFVGEAGVIKTSKGSLVQATLGTKQGAHVGARLFISRGNEYVASAEVVSVRSNTSMARLIPRSIRYPAQVGDEVRREVAESRTK